MVGRPGSVVLLLLQPGLDQHNALPPGVGSFQQYYEAGPLKNHSSSTIAWIPSLQLFFLFALGPVVGMIVHNYGPRPLIIGKTLLHVFGLMASLAKTYYQFIFVPGTLAFVSTWFSKKRGAAIGIMVTGPSVSGVIFPIMISRMMPSTGYPWAMSTAAFLILALQIIAILTVRPRTKPVPRKMPTGRFAALFTEFPLSPLPEMGYRLGVVFLAISIPALTMAPIGGAILQNSANGWLDVKIFGGVMCLAGSAIVLLSRWLYTEKKLLKVF
ncbi:hypothetical protein CFD26_100012 [Aspergillus turcosus]|uniref:Major facilitator superfamily (MFS) profile domain-containing protein n=1 Tax=Aspergillus turcosus TaxID=1245748 RepID=A0A421CUG2_9EURO|nr:hypothetical protein CFD26_100012 [Aspergillus turcosus]